jgi:hypothetical protein
MDAQRTTAELISTSEMTLHRQSSCKARCLLMMSTGGVIGKRGWAPAGSESMSKRRAPPDDARQQYT